MPCSLCNLQHVEDPYCMEAVEGRPHAADGPHAAVTLQLGHASRDLALTGGSMIKAPQIQPCSTHAPGLAKCHDA